MVLILWWHEQYGVVCWSDVTEREEEAGQEVQLSPGLPLDSVREVGD